MPYDQQLEPEIQDTFQSRILELEKAAELKIERSSKLAGKNGCGGRPDPCATTKEVSAQKQTKSLSIVHSKTKKYWLFSRNPNRTTRNSYHNPR